MNFKKLGLVLLAFSFILPVIAQKKAVYLRYPSKEVKVRDSADYIRIFSKPDSGARLFEVVEYYKNGTLKLTANSSSMLYLNRTGTCTDYYSNGKASKSATYSNNSMVGEVIQYYPNGRLYLNLLYPSTPVNPILHKGPEYLVQAAYDSLGNQTIINGEGYCRLYDEKFITIIEQGAVKKGNRNGEWNVIADSGRTKIIETYKEGELIKGKAVSKDGITSTYAGSRDLQPDYNGGMQAFYAYLAKSIHYPVNSRRQGVQGRVIVQFVVEKDGKLTDVKSLAAPSTELAEESVRVVQQSPEWIPGKQFGRNVRVLFTIPIQFTLPK